MSTRKIDKNDAIEKILVDILQELYEQEIVEELRPKVINLIESKKVFNLSEIISSIETDIDDIPFYIFAVTTFNNCTVELKQSFSKIGNNDFKIFFLLEDIEDIISTQKGLKEQWKQISKTVKLDNRYKCIKIPTTRKHNFMIEIKSCLNRLEYESNYIDSSGEDLPLEGLVYTAKLKDIIEIYNKIGDVLFNKNVRYKINDTLEVDLSIRKTLSTNPKNFWFFNNGIAVLAIKDNLSENKETAIKYTMNSEKDLQIINGAQTVSCAANYYYELKNKEKELENELKSIIDDKLFEEKQEEIYQVKNWMKDFDQAYVILRLIFYKNISKNPLDPFYANVSTSLNRQKPIQNYDLKYSSDEIRIINNLYRDNDCKFPYFYILKSGEDNTLINNSYSLIYFTKILAIYYLQLPNKARSGKSSLLSNKNWENFKKKDNEAEDCFFKRLFSPFIFADNVFRCLDDFSKKEHIFFQDDTSKKICSYSKEYLVALIVLVLNDNKSNDFSKWRNPQDVTIDLLQGIIIKWIEENKRIFDVKLIDSNLYKKKSTYEEIKNKVTKEFKDLIKTTLVIN